jgi:hypothetical protein
VEWPKKSQEREQVMSVLPILIDIQRGYSRSNFRHEDWKRAHFGEIAVAVKRALPKGDGRIPPARSGGFRQAIRVGHDPSTDDDLNTPPADYRPDEESRCPVQVWYTVLWHQRRPWVAAKDAVAAWLWGNSHDRNAPAVDVRDHTEASEAAEHASAIIRSRIQPPEQPPPDHIYRATSQGPVLAPVKHGKPGDTFIVFQEHDSMFRVLHVASGLGIAAAKKVTAAKQLCAELNAVPDGSCRGIGYHPDDATLKRWMAISDEFIGKHQDKFWK